MPYNICPICNKSLSFNNDEAFCDNCKTYRKKLSIIRRQLLWAADKSWLFRLPILFWFGYMLVQNWHDTWFSVHHFFNPIVAFNFGIHELGHPLLSMFGIVIYYAGGSIFQCLFPIMWIIALFYKRWYFASALCWGWLGINLFSVATYASDANSRLLPLSGWGALSGDNSDQAYDNAHDWYQILSRTHHLNWDQTIGHFLRIAGSISFLIGLTIASILIFVMIKGSISRKLNLHN